MVRKIITAAYRSRCLLLTVLTCKYNLTLIAWYCAILLGICPRIFDICDWQRQKCNGEVDTVYHCLLDRAPFVWKKLPHTKAWLCKLYPHCGLLIIYCDTLFSGFQRTNKEYPSNVWYVTYLLQFPCNAIWPDLKEQGTLKIFPNTTLAARSLCLQVQCTIMPSSMYYNSSICVPLSGPMYYVIRFVLQFNINLQT